MKAMVRKSDLINGKISSRSNINLYDDELTKCKDSFMMSEITIGGYKSSKLILVDIPDDSVLVDDKFIIFSEESYLALKSKYTNSGIIYGKPTPSKTIRDIAMCNYMNDPYDIG